jgi:hypothetical protein
VRHAYTSPRGASQPTSFTFCSGFGAPCLRECDKPVRCQTWLRKTGEVVGSATTTTVLQVSPVRVLPCICRLVICKVQLIPSNSSRARLRVISRFYGSGHITWADGSAKKNLEPAQFRIAFLRFDLDLATTFVGVAKTALGLDLKQSKGLLEKARVALDTVRRFGVALSVARHDVIKTPPRIAYDQAETAAKWCDELESSISRI